MLEIFLSNSSISGFFELNTLALLVVDKVRGQVTAVELHALDNVEFVCQAGAFFNRDNAFLADLLHCFGDNFTDFRPSELAEMLPTCAIAVSSSQGS